MAPSEAGAQGTPSLTSGSYRLTLSMAPTGASGISTCAMAIGGPLPPFSAVFVPTSVHVERAGNSATITPDDPSATFRMQLQIAGAALSGTASGQYRSSATPITVTGTSSAAPAVVRGILGSDSASGVLDGTVSVDSMSCTNNGHEWTLTAR